MTKQNLDYNEMLSLIAVGCDNGTLNLFLFNKDDPTKYTEITGDKIHTARIMNVVIDERQLAVAGGDLLDTGR